MQRVCRSPTRLPAAVCKLRGLLVSGLTLVLFDPNHTFLLPVSQPRSINFTRLQSNLAPLQAVPHQDIYHVLHMTPLRVILQHYVFFDCLID